MKSADVLISGDRALMTFNAYHAKMMKNPGDCGFDLYPVVEKEEDVQIEDLGFYLVLSIPTKINLLIPEGTMAMIIGRSSSVNKLMGCSVVPGIIDHGYVGEYKIRVQVPIVESDVVRKWKLLASLVRYSSEKVALAQAIIFPFVTPVFELTAELPRTGRGANGFGSTDRPLHTVDILSVYPYEADQPSGGTHSCPTCGSTVKVHEYQCADCLRDGHEAGVRSDLDLAKGNP